MNGVVDHPVDDTWYLYFPTYDSNGASVTVAGLAVTDVEIYADGSPTTRASDNGYTLLDTDGVDFAGHVGIHGLSVDSSNNSDAGFYAAGSHYLIAVDAITVDGQTVRFFWERTIGKFLHPTTAGRTLTVSANGEGSADLTFIHGSALTETAGQLAAAFVKFYNVASPTATALSLPDAVPDAAGGLPVSDAGGLDLDDIPKRLDRNADFIESQRGSHTWQGDYYYVDPVNGDTHASGNRGGRADPYKTIQDCHDNAVTDNNHDVIFLVSGAVSGATTHTVAATTTISKNYVFIRGPGRNFIVTRTGSGDTIAITGDGVEISGVRIGTAATGSGDGIHIEDADFARIHDCWFLDTQGDGVHILRGSNCRIHDNNFEGTGVAGSGDGIHIVGTAGSSNDNAIFNNQMNSTVGDTILIEQGTTNDTLIYGNDIHDAGGWGINIGGSSTRAVVYNNVLGNNSSGDITDSGSNSIIKNNNAWLDKGGYAGGAVFLNTNASNTNTVSYVDGVEHNPVSTLAAAITIAGNVNVQKIVLVPGSSIALTQPHDNWIFDACHSIIALGGQSVNNAIFYGAVITGDDDGSNASHVQYFDCVIGASTLGQFVMTRCYFTSTLTLAQAGSYFMHQCFSGVAGTSTPSLDFGSGLNASNVNMRDYSGGIEIENMGKGTGNYNMSLEGNGQLVVNANSTADGGGTSTVAIRGNFTVTPSGGGAVTLSDDARIDVGQITTSTFDPANDDVAVVTLVTTTTTNTDMLTAAAVKTAIEADGSKLDHLWETTEDDGGTRRFTANALEEAPSGAGGDATVANQTTIITHLTDVKGTAFVKDTDSLIDLAHTGDDGDTLETLSDQLDGLAALSGEGAFTGTLTIDDGSTGLQGVVVNARRGGVLKASGTTDASGEITNWVFGAFTYDLAVRLDGYEPETDTITVSADAWAKTISLTANFITPPPNASTTTGVMTVYDEEQVLEAGVTITVQILAGPGIDGIGYDSTEWAETSDGSGVVQFAGIVHGARYKIWRGTAKAAAETFTAPTSGVSFDLPEVRGRG